ncbi:TPA: hypothetical protein QCS32_006303, partial [Bacillus thuringiensis]|nr:hypothetical protein [Bacillus thuringiensis]
KQELTRELYTPIRGTTYRTDQSQNTLSAIENRMTRKPHLFEWLTQLKIELKREESTSYWVRGWFMTGLGQWIETTLGSNHKVGIGTGGTHYSEILNIKTNNQKNIIKVNINLWFEPRIFQGVYRDGQPFPLAPSVEEIKPFSPNGPKTPIYDKNNVEDSISRHRVSYWMYEPGRSDARPFIIDTWTQLGATTFAWTHDSVDENNTISKDKITQIPAVKAYYADANIRKGPGNTGGDLVEITKNSSDNTHLQTWV